MPTATTHAAAAVFRGSPRLSVALTFGALNALAFHLAWRRGAANGHIMLTLGVGLAYAVAGALMGARLIDPVRTRSEGQAAAVGAVITLYALVMISCGLSLDIARHGTDPVRPVGFGAMTALVAVFAFAGAGWALLILSMAAAWFVHRITRPPKA